MVRADRPTPRTGIRAVLALVHALALLPLAATLAMSRVVGVPVDHLTRDPLAVAKAGVYLGFLSNVGVLGWCAGASIGLFAGGCLARRTGFAIESRFLLAFGALTAWLMADDLWVIHEQVGKRLPAVGERGVHAAYMAVTGILVLVFRRVIRETCWPILLIALGWFGVAVFLDDFPYAYVLRLPEYFAEDAAKFLGIATWSAYLIDTAAAWLSPGATGESGSPRTPGVSAADR